jgi:hypothetical protein
MTDYDPTVWVNGVPPAVNATNLNKIENGIDTAHSELAAHIVDAADPHSVTKTQVGVNIKVKLDATTAPTVTDDSDAGYGVQSRWTNVTLDKEYVCLDASVGAAVWTEITGGAAHDLGGASHNADTLVNLNSKVSDATLIDTADSRLSDDRDPTAHATKHVDGTDDIRDATNALKGLATPAQITTLEANLTHKTSDGSDHTFIDQSVISGASPTFDGTNITAIPSTNINFNILGTPTYKTAQDWFNVIQTSGIISGFGLSNTRLVTELDVAAGTGIIKITDSEIGSSVSFDFAGIQNVTLTSNNINYIYLDYNVGAPQIVATTNRASIELNRHFIIGRVYKCDSTLCVLNAGIHLPNMARNEHERLVERDGFTYSSGAITSETGTLNLAITAGVWFLGHNRLTTDALDSSVADTWIYTHYEAVSWITDNAAAIAVDTTHYNDGTDVLASLGSNNYGAQWVYISTDSHWYIIYDTINGTLSAAQAATPPTSLPSYLKHMGELIAKIIHKQDGTIVSIEITQDVEFTAAGVPNHNDTGAIQGGAANDYQHLTTAELGKLTGIEASADVTDAANIAAAIVGAVAKGTPIDADTFALIDSADSNTLKEVTGIALKAYLKTYNDTLYAAALGADDNYVTDTEKVIIGNTSGTNTGDDPADDTAYNESTWDANTDAATKNVIRDKIELMLTDISTNLAKVTNATHTGEVTGSGALTVDKTIISGKGVVTAVGTDYVLIGDTSDSNNLKKALVSDFGNGAGITAESFSSNPAHLTTDQDAGKAFTISSFPEHAQIKKISVRADFTAGQQSNTGSALINDGTGVAPADTSIVYDGDSPTDLFATDDQILIDSEWMDVTAVNTSTNTLTVTRGIKGTMAAYHDDNAVITKGNHGIRIVLFKDSSKKYSERIIELSSMMTYKGITDAAISANDDYFGLTADIQNLGNNDFLVIEDTADEICKVQNVNHNVVSATYDYTIFVQDDLAAHDITKNVKKLIIFDLDVPYSSGAGTLYGTVFVDEKITATTNVKVEIETDSYT